ncbi:protein SENSITIVE TO UV 2 [Jatropha curcas]|uniref:protein SENSITIVE TO UV 2 n=1 Tax=Jatropha curcas TaxID=180498 RepID=UPI0018937B1B|nr:protein SENSITIVE TO UV 2 [Jatropha curcas]
MEGKRISEDDFEDWDPDFVDQVLQEVERTSKQQQQQHHLSYSPPRQLSHRPVTFDDSKVDLFSSGISLPQDDAKDREIDRLKRELGHVSKQLLDLERECFELRNERNKKEEQIKEMGFYHLKNTKL